MAHVHDHGHTHEHTHRHVGEDGRAYEHSHDHEHRHVHHHEHAYGDETDHGTHEEDPMHAHDHHEAAHTHEHADERADRGVDLMALLQRTLALVATRGAEFSAENRDHLLAVHDRASHMLNMSCCGLDGCPGHAGETDLSGRARPVAEDDGGASGLPHEHAVGSDHGADDLEHARIMDAALPALKADLAALQAEYQRLAADSVATRHLLDRGAADLAAQRLESQVLRAEVAVAQAFLARAEQVGGERPTQRARALSPTEVAALPYEERMAALAASPTSGSLYVDAT